MNKKKRIQSCILLLGLLFCTCVSAQELYIATNGNDSNDGTIDNPLATLIGARDKARSTGIKTIYIREGRYFFDTTCELDAQDSGITFSGYNNERVIIDGSKFINPEEFELVANDRLLGKLHDKAQGNVYSQIITDNDLKALLDLHTAQMSMNDKMISIARFPNIGFAHMDKNTILGETKNAEGTHEDPKGPEFKLVETIDASKWSAEIGRINKVRTKGYLSADWFKEEHEVSAISASGDIKLKNGSRYGVLGDAVEENRLFFYNLLCELDEPGEWYYDSTDSRLYLWPTSVINENSTIGVWAGPQCFEINEAQDIQIKNMTIQNLGKGEAFEGAINVIGASKNILIAGVTFRYIASPLTAFNIWDDVKDSKVLSCDFYDVLGSRLYGGKVFSTAIDYGNNSVENCHFTQIYSKDFYGGVCTIEGAGNTFRNNLIHNMNGQPIVHRGVDHLIELNELFNVGIEEGDGGAIYTGGDLASYGNIIQHNFIHHIMGVPGFFGRMGVYLDDRDSGDIVRENVFYKGGMYSVLVNSGTGIWVRDNVILNGWVAIRSNSGGTAAAYTDIMSRLTTESTSTAKENYVGRMLQKIGVPGWQTGLDENNWIDRIEPFWTDRYPLLRPSMQAMIDNKLAKPYETRFHDNMIYNSTSGKNYENPLEVDIQGTVDINLGIFENPDMLNLKFNEPKPDYAPNIPFENIGLYKDEYRCDVPDKNIYRQKVMQRFDGQECYSASSVYDYNTVNDILYYNSGAEVYKMVPCLGAIEEPGDDSYTIKGVGETCPGKENGQIKIQAKESGTYVANLDGGADINFSDEWTIEDLVPGSYELCITNQTTTITQCYGLDIEVGSEVTGKLDSDFKSGKIAFEITKGTAPYNVFVNNEMVLETNSSSFSVDAVYGDVVEVKTSVVCEGVLSKTMDGIASALPNPTEGNFSIMLSMPVKDVTVEVYNVYSQLVSSKIYTVNNGKIELDINENPAGIYFAVLQMGKNKSKTLKIIKK